MVTKKAYELLQLKVVHRSNEDVLTTSVAKEYKVVLSIDPRDYMRCSHGTDWDSCHQLGNMHGDGAIEYCISPMALIAYIEDVDLLLPFPYT